MRGKSLIVEGEGDYSTFPPDLRAKRQGLEVLTE